MIYQLQHRRVQLQGGGHYIAPNASVIGSVVLEQDVSIWFNVVIRADYDSIHIGAGSNIQDGSVLHVDPGFPIRIGSNVTVGHKAMLHGCSIGDGSMVGINAVVLNGAKIGRGCLIGANALVPAHMEVPDGAMVLGSPAKVKRIQPAEERSVLLHNADHYVANGKLYAEYLQVDDDSR
jgi:carbonic anhydrase/acetyltransferase-like protein (isoleucine patch superfamily)